MDEVRGERVGFEGAGCFAEVLRLCDGSLPVAMVVGGRRVLVVYY
jgi:hypothetical protein